MKVFEPTFDNPYFIDDNIPTEFRNLCYAGLNRSASTRQFLKSKLSNNHKFHPTFGYGLEHEAVPPDLNDGFNLLFGTAKEPSYQTQMFIKLGYNNLKPYVTVKLLADHELEYEELFDEYWEFDPNYKQVVIITIDDEHLISELKEALLESNVDLVIIRVPDSIYNCESDLVPMSYEAYSRFVNKISKYFTFQNK
jgi:hypothetical protein